jgi:hypothetical protein
VSQWTAANKAKAAALTAYLGGTVNRVVLLSDGQYNVHMIADTEDELLEALGGRRLGVILFHVPTTRIFAR